MVRLLASCCAHETSTRRLLDDPSPVDRSLLLMMTVHRRAKIVATIGPATDTEESLEALLAAGVDVVRLNFSHGTHDEHARRLQMVRSIAGRLNRPIAVML